MKFEGVQIRGDVNPALDGHFISNGDLQGGTITFTSVADMIIASKLDDVKILVEVPLSVMESQVITTFELDNLPATDEPTAMIIQCFIFRCSLPPAIIGGCYIKKVDREVR